MLGVYDRCVYKFDHYCVWIGNCVGGLNHRYFLALLFSLSAMCIHGICAIINVFSAAVAIYHIQTTGGAHLIAVTIHWCHTVESPGVLRRIEWERY